MKSVATLWWPIIAGWAMLMFSWQLLAPANVGSDEPWHVARAWTAANYGPDFFGTVAWERDEDWNGGEMSVPAQVFGQEAARSGNGWECFLHQIEVPAVCAGPANSMTGMVSVRHPVSDYPPFVYSLIGLPAKWVPIDFAYVAMRGTTFLLTIAPVVFAAYLVRRTFTARLSLLLISPMLVGSVAFHATGVSLDGPLFGACIGFGVLMAHLYRSVSTGKSTSPHLIQFAAVLGNYAAIIKATGALTVGALLIALCVVSPKFGLRLSLRVLPGMVVAASLAVLFPFGYPAGGLSGVENGTFSELFFAQVSSIVQNTATYFLIGDFQVARMPWIFGIPLIAWILVQLGVRAQNFTRRDFLAAGAAIGIFLTVASLAALRGADVWYLGWQGRYNLPFLGALIIWAAWSSRKRGEGPQFDFFGIFSIIFFNLGAWTVALNRFYFGVAIPAHSDWWVPLTGVVAENPILFSSRPAVASLFYVTAHVLVLGCLVVREVREKNSVSHV